jgi:hypothetical protein
MFFINKLKFEVKEHHRNGEPRHDIGKVFTETNALSSKEWSESKRMSRASIWTFEVIRLWIESFGDKL